MTRDLRRLADTRFDVVVVGAGIYGAIAAWDAVLRGLTVALIDRGDYGAGTSFNNLKTLHGGLRSLQTMNLSQMRRFIRERRTFARIAPHLVAPLAFVVPTYGAAARSSAAMRVALTLNDLVSRDRHEGIEDPALHLPAGGVVTREECLRLNPLVNPDGVTGGAVWHDYQMHNTDRMTFSFVLSAAERGAVTANYVEAIALIREGPRTAGVTVADRETGAEFAIRSSAVVNAAGPWASALLERLLPGAMPPASRLSRAMNLVVRPVARAQACGGLAAGRFLFVVPWRDASILGTSHDGFAGRADDLQVTAADLDTFLAEAREAFPAADLRAADVRLVHRGLLPTVDGSGPQIRLLRESAVVDHRHDGAPGFFSMFGVRYTTARDTAVRAITSVLRHRGTRSAESHTAATPLYGGNIADKNRFVSEAVGRAAGWSADGARRLAITYGTRFPDVLALAESDARFTRPLGSSCAVTAAEIVHAVRRESAIHLSDALIRRTEAGSAGHPGTEAIASAADLMSRELGWSAAQRQREIELVEEFYRLP